MSQRTRVIMFEWRRANPLGSLRLLRSHREPYLAGRRRPR